MKKIISAAGVLVAVVAALAFSAAPALAQLPQITYPYDRTLNCQIGTASGCASRTAQDPYPTGATPETAASGDVAAATAAASLATSAAKTTYISGFDFTSSGSTAAATVVCTVTGVITGTLSFDVTTVAGATLGNVRVSQTFPYPLPASAVNTAIVVSCPSLGTGNLHASMNAYGFLK